MGKHLGRLLGLVAALGAVIAQTPTLRAKPPLDYSRDIRPILSNNCFYCHGPDPDQRKGGDDGLRLDTAEGAASKAGDSFAIVPGKPDESEVARRISAADPDVRMPPPETGKKLSAREIELISEWIRQGGKFSEHWAYVPPILPPLPEVRDSAWARNAIDAFILENLDRQGLKPSPEADRETLIRRVSLDLTGLPPTPAEAEAFLADTDPQAYEKLVDRLLNKPAYGEYWAQLWLDQARYADSAGYADDPPRTIWLYRDYVIKSFNANKPFDQFTIEQIAGDLLPDPTSEQLVATAFHRNTLTNNEGGTNDEEFRNVAIVDRVNTTLAVWMGATMACAQCHSHKYDPITQEDYFRLFAIFNNTEDADRGDESPLYSAFSEEQQQCRAEWQRQLAEVRETLDKPSPELQAARRVWEAKFPLDILWQAQTAEVVATAPQAQAGLQTIKLTPAPGPLHAIRLVSPPRELAAEAKSADVPAIGRVSGAIVDPLSAGVRGRFVRIELPGPGRILSLAEVQAFRGEVNIALNGVATQSSVDYDGQPRRAIDGNLNGVYYEANSTTHTQVSDNPWWEVDLGAEQSMERLVVWNRTDGGVGERLANCRLLVLDAERRPIWERVALDAPNPSQQFSLDARRELRFVAATSDAPRPGFDPSTLIASSASANSGKQPWKISNSQDNQGVNGVTLSLEAPVLIDAGDTVLLSMELAATADKASVEQLQVSTTSDARVLEYARAPAEAIAALGLPAEKRSAEQLKSLSRYFIGLAPETKQARDTMAELNKQLAELKPDTVPIMRELPSANRRATRIQRRGNFLDLDKQVEPGTPKALGPPLPSGPVSRLDLARWLMDAKNPLTARVLANRFWEQIFGIGIVASSEDFGAQGDLPVHPELLDYLAVQLQTSHWDVKAMLKLLVTSSAYRQSSRVNGDLQERDPDNRWLARGPRVRLSAETVRDQALAVSGLLSVKMYGPPVKPVQPDMGLSAAFGGGLDWKTSDGQDRYRRALYTTWRRSSPYPSMATFDAPNREVCTLRRSRTNTPLQALVTLNDPAYVEAAQSLAREIIAGGGASSAERVRYGFRLCLLRDPQPAEAERLLKLFERNRQRFEKAPEEARKLATEPLGPTPAGVNEVELAAWTATANVLLNLDEFLMKR